MTISEANEFQVALRISEKAKKQYTGPYTRGWDKSGGGGSGGGQPR
ncbi:MAG: hypothetical protein ACXVZ3_07810 [Gaiellaceae bacterium]